VADVARSASTAVLPAPVAAGMMMRGSNYQFSMAPPEGGETGVRLTLRQIWAAASSDGADQAPIQTYLGAANTANLTFDPDDTKTMPPPLTSLAQVFGRYRLKKALVIYTPTIGTTDPRSIAFAVLTDAAAARLYTGPSFIQVMENSNSAGGPVWSMLSVDVPCDNMLRFTNQTVADASLTAAEERQDHAFGLVAALNSAGAAAALGYFHLELTIDFYEVISQLNETSLLRMERRLSDLRAHMSRQVKRDASSVRDDEKKSTSSSLEASPQESLSGGWYRAPSGRDLDVSLRATLTRESQAAGLVKSQSHKG